MAQLIAPNDILREDLDKALNRQAGFKHPPIDARGQIRLIRLLPDQELPGSVCAELCIVGLRSLPALSYKALSYTWGCGKREQDVRKIKVNQQSFHVRKNLYDFLCSGIQRKEIGWFFIDAICINQLDHEERRFQVQDMSKIFRNASQVISWLGAPEGDQENSLHELSTSLGSDTSGWTRMQWHGFALLSYNPYWSRMWVLQEVLLAKDIRIWCGRYTFRVELLEGAVRSEDNAHLGFAIEGHPNVRQHSTSKVRSPAQTILSHRIRHIFVPSESSRLLDNSPPGTMEEMVHSLRKPATVRRSYQTTVPDNLHQILHKFGRLECSDPRDKLYGLLGILNERTQRRVLPDYDRDSSYACYQALKVGIGEILPTEDDILPGNAWARENGHSAVMFYCDVRDSFGLDNSESLQLLKGVTTELGVAGIVQDAVFRAQWHQQFGWSGSEKLMVKSPFAILTDTDDEAKEPPEAGGLLFRLHEKQRSLLSRLANNRVLMQGKRRGWHQLQDEKMS